jgi:HlyD family secretion protein
MTQARIPLDPPRDPDAPRERPRFVGTIVASWPAVAWLRRHGRVAAVALVAAAIAVPVAPRLLFGPEVQVTPVVRRDLVQSVVASGRVEAPHRVTLGVPITGTVQRVAVAEGQLESAELGAAVAQADVAVRQAAARLRQLQEVQAPVAEQAVLVAQANHEAARHGLVRSRDLFGRGFIGQAALDESHRAERVALAQLNSARQQRDSVLPAGSDTSIAVSALAQARAGAQAAHARLRYATVKAPAAGTLIARSVEPGDVVQPGKGLLVLSPAGQTQLVVQIDEKNLRLLRVGQPAIASADAYAQRRFAAEIVHIDSAVDPQRGSIEVKLGVPAAPAELRQDMTVSVDIEVARRAGATLVPVDALHDVDSPSPWVLRVEDGRVRRRPVRLGLVSSGWCEVLDGLREADLVVPDAPSALADGARIRPLARITP